MEKKNIVVLGAGFGGLRTAMRIAKSLRHEKLLEQYNLILIDRNDAQAYTPVLYELAAAPAGSGPKNITFSVAPLIKGMPITFTQGEVREIDLTNGDIHLATGEEIKAEFLVIALGSEANYFGIPGMQEHTIPLKTYADSQKIRAALDSALKASVKPRIVVGGAGANGIEMAGQIKSLHPQCDVTLVEAMPSILPGLDAKVIESVGKRLKKLGIAVMTNSKITAVEANAVKLESADVPFDLMIWTGGIKAPDLVGKLPLHAERGRPVAEVGMICLPQTPDLKLYPMVYALGDSVCFHDAKTGRPVPATAPVAMAQAEIVAHNIIEEIKTSAKAGSEEKQKTPYSKTYFPTQYPYVIPVGGRWAAAKIGELVISGWPAWCFAKLVELDYLISIMPLTKAIAAWL